MLAAPFEKEVVISCENLHKTYLLGVEGVPALRGVSFDIFRGEFLVIYGTSGGGKSTLLNVLGTIDAATKGNLSLLNARVTDRTPDALLARLRCRHIGFVFQSFNLLSTMTAEENVALPMIIAGDRSPSEIKERARQLLTDVGLGHRFTHTPGQLSGGEQQRVTIARALANNPEILFLDEPTGDLDTLNTHLVMSILLDLNRNKGLTMVMVTHDVYMKQYAHRVMHLRDGKIHTLESIPTEASDAAITHLKEEIATAEERRAYLRDHPPGLVSVTRMPTDYATYRGAAPIGQASAAHGFAAAGAKRVAHPFENPLLLDKLFGHAWQTPNEAEQHHPEQHQQQQRQQPQQHNGRGNDDVEMQPR